MHYMIDIYGEVSQVVCFYLVEDRDSLMPFIQDISFSLVRNTHNDHIWMYHPIHFL